MKCNITISIDQEIITQLKQENNYSDVINEQMKAYYTIKEVQNIRILQENLSKIKQELKEKRKKEREIKLQIEKVKQREKDIIEKTKIRIKEKPEQDPIRDPELWKEKGWDKQYTKEWNKHLDFVRRYNDG